MGTSYDEKLHKMSNLDADGDDDDDDDEEENEEEEQDDMGFQ